MAKALFITTKDLKRYSVLNGNIDPDKLTYWVEIAQDTEIQNYLGTQLLEKLQDLILAGTIGDPANVAYETLLETYVKPMTIYWALTLYMPFAAYTVANGGVYKHTSESSISVDKDEVDYLANKYRDIAQFYTNTFIDFMVYNQTTYPEYNSNTNDDTYPDQGGANFGGWVL
jgi:hypothetical protein